MENNQLSAVHNSTPAFIQDATNSLEKMEAYASMLIKSGLVPKHFYELDQYRNPVKDANGVPNGNTSAVIMTIQHGLELGMSITQSLQQIVPVNGLMSVKGDAAKALIMKSGLCKEWTEEEVGTGDELGVRITSVRKDGQKITRTFTVKDAKRAGLWIDDAMVAKNDKLRHSPWYKYQSRMLRYRALGFMARDLYGDVLQNMYTEDEARDLNEDNTVMQTPDGMNVKITDNTNGSAMTAAAENLLDGSKPQTTTGSTSTLPRTRTTKKAATPPPAETPKVDPVIEDATFEDVPQTPALKPLEEVREMAQQALFAYMQEVIGFDMQSRLFEPNPEKKTKRILVELYTALLAGQTETYIKANFETEEAPSKPLIEPNVESGVEWPALGADGKRSIGDAFTVYDAFEAKGIKEEDIIDALTTNGVEFSSVEDFYKRADSSILNLIYNA